MVGDDADGCPSRFDQFEDAAREPVEFALDQSREGDRFVMVAVVVDLAGLPPTARTGPGAEIQRAVTDDLVAAPLDGFP